MGWGEQNFAPLGLTKCIWSSFGVSPSFFLGELVFSSCGIKNGGGLLICFGGSTFPRLGSSVFSLGGQKEQKWVGYGAVHFCLF